MGRVSFFLNRCALTGESSQKMPMLAFEVGRLLSEEQRGELEQRLGRRLGIVTCVRHPPAIDDVRVSADAKGATIAVSACCELSARRAKIIVAEMLEQFASTLP